MSDFDDNDDEDLYDLDDEALEAAFKEAKAGLGEDFDEDLTNPPNEGVVASEEELDEEIEFDEEEQPDNSQDSGNDGEEEDLEPAEGEEEGQSEEDPISEQAAATKTTTEPKVHTFRAAGTDYTLSQEEILQQFPKVFAQAMDYTKKMQTIKPWRKTIDAMEQAKVSHEDINLMLDVLSGNKDALSEVLRRTGVDALDLDTNSENPYIPNDHGRDESVLYMQEVIDNIKTDPEYERTHSIVGKQWDEASWQVLKTDPIKIQQLHNDVKSGMYDTLKPIADRLKLYDGAKHSDLDYYLGAAKQYFSEQEQRQEVGQMSQQLRAAQERQRAEQLRISQQEAKTRSSRQQAAKGRKAAGITGSRASSSGITDYLEASEEEFDAWYKQLEERM